MLVTCVQSERNTLTRSARQTCAEWISCFDEIHMDCFCAPGYICSICKWVIEQRAKTQRIFHHLAMLPVQQPVHLRSLLLQRRNLDLQCLGLPFNGSYTSISLTLTSADPSPSIGALRWLDFSRFRRFPCLS